ncbi:hypothetical protein V490_04419 [Pseudogymnoascus sp. VKM F-3557]|nr:hypothetical protein V490_04419 [Pseudogymnoascus sp. VKM F-3557]
MKGYWQRRMPFIIVLLQVIYVAAHTQPANPHAETNDLGSNSDTPPVALSALQNEHGQHSTEYYQGLVGEALSFLEPLEQRNSRYSSLQSSRFSSTALYFLNELISRLYFSAPPIDQGTSDQGAKGKDNGQTLRGPLADGVALLRESAKYNNSDAIYLLAQMSFYGNFSYPQNLTESFQRYSQLASLSGNSSAQHMIGFMYATGVGGVVQRDPAKALLHHTFAAQAGHSKSEMTVAFRYQNGIGTSRNCDEAVTYYKKVADKAIAWYRSDEPGGKAWVPDSYSLADENGGVYGEGASASSAGMNAHRAGGTLDTHAALDDVLEYLDLMSGKGDFKATFSLGRIHYNGQKGLNRDMKAARKYFQAVVGQFWKRDGTKVESTDRPDIEKFACNAAGYLGRMYMRGEGVDVNYDKAVHWFRRGITGGDAGSQNGLGLMYLHGLKVSKDATKAADLFRAAADQDYAPAQVNLAKLHLDQGRTDDIQIARSYFELAARYGNIEAYYYLAEIANFGLGRDRSCGLAAAYYKTVSEKAEPLLSSFAEANEAYASGNRELALLDYMMAAEQGYERGQSNVAYLLDQENSILKLSTHSPLSKPRSTLLEDPDLALVYWTRSAKQSNIDSMVKMGDYYLKGIGSEPDMEKAAACYTAASEFHQSAQALYNLGWMHENGVGLIQDFHLAKRFYDEALETNDEAYFPVTLSLLKLRLRSAWNTLTHGRVNSIRYEPAPSKQWSLSEWINNFMEDDRLHYMDYEEEDLLHSNDPTQGADDGMYDDVIDDGVVESFIIIALAGALVWLIYYRQQRQLAHRQNDGAARGQANQPRPVGGQQAQPDGGVFPRNGDPAFGQWVAGGTCCYFLIITDMSAQDAKRRRADSTAAALSKPFRSPFRAAGSKPHGDSPGQPSDPGRTQLDESASPLKVSHVSRARNPPSFPYKLQRGVNLPSRPPNTSKSQSEIASLVKAQRQLKNRLHYLTEELHLCEQAHKIEHDPLEPGSGGEEVDGELLRLTERWKSASRQAAEELFGSAKDKINRMGGPQAWKEMQEKQRVFQNEFNTGFPQDCSGEMDGHDERSDTDTGADIEQETLNEREARGGDDDSEDMSDNEFTMSMMLRSLNIELEVIGYSKEHQMWID